MGRTETLPSCLICRRRKIKCDRAPGSCHRCRKFGEQCVYAVEARGSTTSINTPLAPGSFVTQAGLKRRRTLLSCEECKRAKIKCSGGTMCDRCRAKGSDCVYRSQARRRQLPPRRTGPHPQTQAQAMPAWLVAEELPSDDRIRQLVDVYFTHIHAVRCLGFLHIPMFTEECLRCPSEKLTPTKSALIAIMCALAAPFYYARIANAAAEEEGSGSLDPSIRFYNAGKPWAAIAMRSIFLTIGNTGIDALMVEVLLHEYYLRVGDYVQAILISGMITRHVQLLQLSIEHDYDITCATSRIDPAMKETRRRLAWTCYLLDASIECGIDQLRYVSAGDVQVQLPCAEEVFVRNMACVTEMMPRGQLLPFLQDTSLLAETASANLDLRAFYIRAVMIRSKVLRYVKHLQGEIPWEEGSQFAQLDEELYRLSESIPDRFQMSPENACVFKASGRLNLFFGLHILVAQTYNDLYRVGVAGLVFPRSATQWIREHAPRQFLRRCHHMCADKVVSIASLLRDLWQRDKPSIVDPPYAIHAQICSSVIVSTLISWTGPEPLLPHLSTVDYRTMLQTNIDILDYLRKYFKADLYHESALQALKQFNRVFAEQTLNARPHLPTSQSQESSSDRARQPPQVSLEYILNPLGIYPMARKQIPDRHQPEGTSVDEDVPESEPEQESMLGVRSSDGLGVDSHSLLPADGAMGSDDLFALAGNTVDWETEVSLMGATGYPTFIEQFSSFFEDGGLN